MKNVLPAILLTMLLTACGGGGGGGTTTTTPADVSFLTVSPDIDNVGESQRFNLNGTVSANGQTETITGSYTVTRKPNEIVGGEEAIVTDSVFVVTIPSQGVSISSSGTTYLRLNGTEIQTTLDTGVICYPDSNAGELPDSVKIGESGVLGNSTCSDSTTISSSYLVEQSNRSSAWAALRFYATYSEPGLADIYEDIVVHISQNGRVHAIDIFAGDGDVTFEMRS